MRTHLILTCPAWLMSRLAGLMSRWICRLSCRKARPCSTCALRHRHHTPASSTSAAPGPPTRGCHDDCKPADVCVSRDPAMAVPAWRSWPARARPGTRRSPRCPAQTDQQADTSNAHMRPTVPTAPSWVSQAGTHLQRPAVHVLLHDAHVACLRTSSAARISSSMRWIPPFSSSSRLTTGRQVTLPLSLMCL